MLRALADQYAGRLAAAGFQPVAPQPMPPPAAA
jgi:hypothetical protein